MLNLQIWNAKLASDVVELDTRNPHILFQLGKVPTSYSPPKGTDVCVCQSNTKGKHLFYNPVKCSIVFVGLW